MRGQGCRPPLLGMEIDRICMESDSDNTFFITFYSNTNTVSNVLEYEYKTDVSNSETHSDIYSSFERQHLPIFLIENLQL
jgi:hypothetical protein